MVIDVAPSALNEVISETPAICANWRSSGAATDEDIVSALAPLSAAVTRMVGKSISGSGATGSLGKDNRPSDATAAASSTVATGRRINGCEKFTSAVRGASQA